MKKELGLKIKKDFPIFSKNRGLVYLDNAATAQMPSVVCDVLNNFFRYEKANVHRGLYDLSENATEKFENSRKIIAKFINAEPEEIIFTSGTTLGLNMLAQMLGNKFKKGDTIVLTRLEHHANLIPWQKISEKMGLKIKYIELDQNLNLDLASAKKVIDKSVKLVSLTHIANSIGVLTPVKQITAMAKKVGALTIVDGAQSIASMPIDVRDVGCDFFVFSGHKIFGPTGVGVIYGRRELLEELEPTLFGGGMISQVSYDNAVWNESPYKFEAGTPPIAEVLGLAKAIAYLQSIGIDKIFKYEQKLSSYAMLELKKVPGLKILGEKAERGPIISFTIEGVHPHDVADILNNDKIAVRAGHHCAMPLMKMLGIAGSIRVSLAFYNSKEDIDKLVVSLKKITKLFA